jgi:hypothetical protein
LTSDVQQRLIQLTGVFAVKNLLILRTFGFLQNAFILCVYLTVLLLVWLKKSVHLEDLQKERRNNNLFILNDTIKKGICKNCGDDIGQDSDSEMFCSEQCGVEYQMEHDKK